MTEERKHYGPERGPTLKAIAKRPCARLYTDPGYVTPTWEDVRDLMNATGWKGEDVAAIAGVSSSRTIRKWTADPEQTKEARGIPYAAWRLLLIESGIVAPVRST